jgi:hypothetical protein
MLAELVSLDYWQNLDRGRFELSDRLYAIPFSRDMYVSSEETSSSAPAQ